jgi:hypothetical protein
MDPTVDVLTIYPAAWAALFQGLAEGLVVGLVGFASVALVATVLAVCLSGLAGHREEEPAVGTRETLTSRSTDERGVVVQLAVVRQRRLEARQRA